MLKLLSFATNKTCPKCGIEKSNENFCKSKNTKDGLNVWCRGCAGKNAKTWKAANPDKSKNNGLRWSFGITLDSYNQMFAEQNGNCAICSRHQSEFKRALAVDHDHQSGRIRSLLCHHCNLMLGCAKDNQTVLADAIQYLQKHIGE